MTAMAAIGSTTRATARSPETIRSDWRPVDRFWTTLAVALLFMVTSCWTCPSRSVDWRAQLDRKNPVTTRVRVTVSACSDTEVLSRVPNTEVVVKTTRARKATTMASVGEKWWPRAWMECVPSTWATATSEMSTRRTAWLRPPTSERRVKVTIFRRSAPRPNVRMTERRESVAASSALGDRVLEKSFITGPVPASDAPLRRSRAESVVPGGPAGAGGIGRSAVASVDRPVSTDVDRRQGHDPFGRFHPVGSEGVERHHRLPGQIGVALAFGKARDGRPQRVPALGKR